MLHPEARTLYRARGQNTLGSANGLPEGRTGFPQETVEDELVTDPADRALRKDTRPVA